MAESEHLHLDIAAESNTGCVRKDNQDNFFFLHSPDRRYLLAVVADGVGGYAGGNYASYYCCHSLMLTWRDFTRNHRLSDERMPVFLQDAITRTGTELFRINHRDSATPRTGFTTIVAAIFTPGLVISAHIGDSRLYCCRKRKLFLLTVDHARDNEAERHLITRAMGPLPEQRPEIHTFFRAPGDRFLLCSDGIVNQIGNAAIQTALTGSPAPRTAVNQMIRQSLRSGARDNITVITVYDSRPAEPAGSPSLEP